jgi:hypothetical protein
MAATGLPVATKEATKLTASRLRRSVSGFTVPPGRSSASYSSADASDTCRSTENVPAETRSNWRAWISPGWIDSRSVLAPAP